MNPETSKPFSICVFIPGRQADGLKIVEISNSIQPLAGKRFSDQKFTERHHLQEWLANSFASPEEGVGL